MKKIQVGNVFDLHTVVTIWSAQVQIPAPEDLVHLQFAIRSQDAPSVTCIARSIAETAQQDCCGRYSRAWPCFIRLWQRCCLDLGDLPFAAIADPKKRLYALIGVESSLRAVLSVNAWGAAVRGAISIHTRRCRLEKACSDYPPTS